MAGQDFGVSVRTLTVLVYVVTAVWAGNVFAPLVVTTYAGNAGVNGIMGALLGLLGAARLHAARNRDDQQDSGPGDDNAE